MYRKRISVLVIVLVSLAVAIPAFAAAPAEGTVVEGHSVPGGVTLGDTRAQVEAKWGEPYICKDQPHFDGRRGIDGICEYEADGLNRVTVRYHAADGTWQSQGTADDVLYNVLWPQSTSGWVTTAGVNTTLALNDPEAVIEAYPDAEVKVDGDFIYYISSPGIAIYRHRDPYFGFISVSMAIGKGIPNPEVWLGYSTVADIDLTHAKIKRNREVTGLVLVHDFQDQPAADATVTVKWFLPDGSSQTDQDVTSSDGVATFQLSGRLDRGTYYLIIDDVELTDHIWNYTGGVTSAKIKVK
ncbi:MAG: hypothetical protein PVF74_11455 [Anaerolineales bacterium]|jgi:hypothetical protein